MAAAGEPLSVRLTAWLLPFPLPPFAPRSLTILWQEMEVFPMGEVERLESAGTLRHFASPRFWAQLQALPMETRMQARRSFALLTGSTYASIAGATEATLSIALAIPDDAPIEKKVDTSLDTVQYMWGESPIWRLPICQEQLCSSIQPWAEMMGY